MTYEQTATETVTRDAAAREIAAHGQSFEEFTAELGDRPLYRAAVVLTWLGY